MISKEEFLKQIEKKVFPLIDTEQIKRVVGRSLIGAGVAYAVALTVAIIWFIQTPHKDVWDDVEFGLVVCPFAVAFLPWTCFCDFCIRRRKKKIRPVVYQILGAEKMPEKKLPGLSVKQLRKLHFLPSYDMRDEDDVVLDSFGLMNEKIPFYIQEVFFTELGKRAKKFQGPVVRFFLPGEATFKLMVLKKSAMLYKDKIALSVKQPLRDLIGGGEWQPLVTESIKFNDRYFCFTNDQIKARTILTPRFMDHIRDVEKIYKAPVNILFYDDQLILAIKTNKDMFEFSTTAQDLRSYEKFYNEIAVLYQFQDFFKLR